MKRYISIGLKTNLLVIAISFLVGLVSIFVSYKVYSSTMDDHYQTLATNLSKTAASVIDREAYERWSDKVMAMYHSIPADQRVSSADWGSDAFNAYLANFDNMEVDDPDYRELFESLRAVYTANDVHALYLCCMDPENYVGIYTFDVSDDLTHYGVFDDILPENRQIFETPEIGFPAYISDMGDYGWLASAGVPVYSEDGRILGYAMVDISMNKVMKDRYDFLGLLILVLLATTVVMIFLFIRVVRRNIVVPIDKMADAANAYIKSENKEVESIFKTLDIHTGDELERLSEAMKEMENDLHSYIENLKKVTADREKIEAELSIATQIQTGLLPSVFPPFPEKTEFDIYASMHPAKEVGGDFYDFFLIDENHLGMVMADVSGKGVPAALFMMQSKALIKNQCQISQSPAEIMAAVNNQLCENNEAEMFVTAWLGIMDIRTGEILAANAGHEWPAIQKAGGEFELIKTKHGFVLGGMNGLKYNEFPIKLDAGDALFLYTDGVAEATNEDNELFGTDRMLHALNRQAGYEPQVLIENTSIAISKFVKEAPQFDDITMLAIRYLGASEIA